MALAVPHVTFIRSFQPKLAGDGMPVHGIMSVIRTIVEQLVYAEMHLKTSTISDAWVCGI